MRDDMKRMVGFWIRLVIGLIGLVIMSVITVPRIRAIVKGWMHDAILSSQISAHNQTGRAVRPSVHNQTGKAVRPSVHNQTGKAVRPEWNSSMQTCNVTYNRDGRVFTNGKILPPALLYLGFGHCGSNTLAYVMDAHPLLAMGIKKEHKYLCSGRGTNARTKSFKGYARQFIVPCEVQMTFDVSPLNFAILLQPKEPMYPDAENIFCAHKGMRSQMETIEDLVEKLPDDLRLFAMLRNPLDWFYSKKRNRTHHFFESEERLNKLIEMGCYITVFERWVKKFPNLPLKIFASEDMFADPVKFFGELFQWLGVHNLSPEYFKAVFNAGGRRRAPRTLTDNEYKRYHSQRRAIECKAQLEKFAGRKFQWKGAA